MTPGKVLNRMKGAEARIDKLEATQTKLHEVTREHSTRIMGYTEADSGNWVDGLEDQVDTLVICRDIIQGPVAL
ncbi:hypothetical protein PG995_014428 [Apiospora arundinis]|uniref:Uncharacterized protein n=1 Tax=Apiospora arundinis TaxID=335852 RepID=A0ABR2IIZ5_9PEZI